MSIKTRLIIKNITKITILSFILTLWFLIINSFVWALNKNEIIIDDNNNINYKNATIRPVANVWVAISSNIWIWLSEKNKINEISINSEIFEIEDFYNNSISIKNEVIIKNMIFIKEYFNILKINFNEILEKSNNREKTLNNIIRQLEIRYKNTVTSIVNLNKQRILLINERERIITKINTLKRDLEIDFIESNSDEFLNNIEDFYSLKDKETILKANIIFLWEFLRRYNILNNYNEMLINTLRDNRDIISKNSYIVIPKSGIGLLKDFNLIFSQEEYEIKKQ